ncbi:hypothetical protein C8F01DRAFT_1081455 [Mycena amicta]|nr:hypothetical protein C8F01DRAFT_1081455 [Mycena amicta]
MESSLPSPSTSLELFAALPTLPPRRPPPSTVDIHDFSIYDYSLSRRLSLAAAVSESDSESMPPAPPPTRASSPPARYNDQHSSGPVHFFNWDAVDLDEGYLEDRSLFCVGMRGQDIEESYFKLKNLTQPLDASFADLLHIDHREPVAVDLEAMDDPFVEYLDSDLDMDVYLKDLMAGYHVPREPQLLSGPAFDNAQESG